MVLTVLHDEIGRELRRHMARLGASIRENVGSLIGQELQIKLADLAITDAEGMLAALDGPYAVVRAALGKDYAGRTMLLMFGVPDVCAMAGLLMLTPEEQIEQRRQSVGLQTEDLEAFDELAAVICTGVADTLRDGIASLELELQDTGQIAPGLDDGKLLPPGSLAAARFRIRVGPFAEASAWVVLDRSTAEAWNRGILGQCTTPEPAAGRSEDDLNDIPAVPIRGTLHAYGVAPNTIRVIRRACRRSGLDLRCHPRAEIPNPAAHRDHLVLIDVPSGEERRFEWCRRIKEFESPARVVLLLHRPSRARVAQAFRSNADVILGLPLDDQKLAEKLNSLPAT